GYQTGWQSADGQETLSYRYDASNRLSGVTSSDGGLATPTYSGSYLSSLQEPASRTVTFTMTGTGNLDLAVIQNPDLGRHTFSYAGTSHRLTSEQFGTLSNAYAYTQAGTLGTFTWGTSSNYALLSAAVQGLSSLVAGTPLASLTDPTSRTT